MKKFSINTQVVVALAAMVMWVALTIATYFVNDAGIGEPGSFLTIDNVSNIMIQMAVTGVIAVGAVLVILTAGIDLSVGTLISFTGVLFALMITTTGGGESAIPVPLAIVLTLIVALIVGLLNGMMVYELKLPPFIATLGMMIILRGGSLLLTGGSDVSGVPEAVGDFGVGEFLGVPYLFWVLIIVVALVDFILKKTSFGRYTYALGSNPEAARLSGVNTRMITYGVYMLASFLGGIAGMMVTARSNMASTTAGETMELDAIAAAVLGGASLMGAEGKAIGSFIGALVMITIYNGANILGIDDNYTKVVVGVILIATVAVDQYRKRKSGK